MESSLPNSAMVENLGHRVDMPTVMREKMEGAFGMDLTAVKLYENKAVGKAGAEAVTQGSSIAFAPGKLDFTSTHGQALLGHEISHAASQARGEVKGSGLVNDSALEERADREGIKAARGESVTSGFGGTTTALSNASAASAAGPMQAKSGKNKKIRERAKADYESANFYSENTESDEDDLFYANESEDTNVKVDKMFQLSAAKLRQAQEYDLDYKNKKDELFPKYYNKYIEEGNSKDSAKDFADDDASAEARGLIREDNYRYLSDEEEEWLQNMFDNASMDIEREIIKRRMKYGREVNEHRQKSGTERPNEDKGKLDLESAYTTAATKFNVYDYMRNGTTTKLNGDISGQIKEETKQNTSDEEHKIQNEAHRIIYNSKDTEKYLKPNEGKKLKSQFLYQQNKKLGELSGKKKRWKRK
ncbi:MAG: DUF4157 domain-containing protein [Anaerolineaceae bacterium]|nr:DUF4157 domain-containing protein [Anaerolineaceae bacterium]